MVTAIVQARMSSARLPGKALAKIAGKPMLWHVIERLKKVQRIDSIVIATTHNPKDEAIVSFAKKNRIPFVRGKEKDVLDRFYQAAREHNASVIVRVTSDCPLLDPAVVKKVLREYVKGTCDYVSNTLTYTYPDGCDVEIFSFKALEKAWKGSKDAAEREHVTPYIRNSGKFRVKNVENEDPVDSSEYKWSVDTKNDLRFVAEVYRHLYKEGEVFSMKDVLRLVKKRPDIKRINADSIMNEGYYKSLTHAGRIRPKKLHFKNSLDLKKRAGRLIPGCSQTFSKGPSQFVQGAAPVFLEKARGCHVWDVDGNTYIDYAMALGPILLGHGYPAVTDAVTRVLGKGTTFSLPHRLEVELSQILCDVIPCAEMVRFGKNGSDATSGAVRLARAYTGKDMIVCCGYHGWQDWYIATTTRDKGIPKQIKNLTITFEYNKIETLKRAFAEHKDRIACVIMEPVGIVEPKDGFLQEVKDITHTNGAILIFDEVVTGFRLSLGGAQGFFKVIPDVACFGKAMGNGFPISAVVGRKAIMKLFEEVFFSFTFGGEIVSIAAAIATITEIRRKNVIAHLWEQGRKLRDGFNVLAREYRLDRYIECTGFPPRTVIMFTDDKGHDWLQLKSLFQQECITRGVLFTGGHNVCYAHTDRDVDYTLRVYNTVMAVVSEAIRHDRVHKMLRGKTVQPIFRRA